jgi:hypothetical protein
MSARRSFRFLTVGDGDFSFSLAFLRSEQCRGAELLATSYDSYEFLVEKYGKAAENNVKALLEAGAAVLHNVDATNLADTLPEPIVVSEAHFMHPLIDAEDKDKLARNGKISCTSDYIVANRLLVLNFLRSAQSLLAPSGEIKVTTKDAYPYAWWRVGRLAAYAPPLRLKRVEKFNPESFPGYVSRTVDRDGTLAVESASSYVFGFQEDTAGTREDADSVAARAREFVCDTCDKTFTSEGTTSLLAEP